MNKPHVVRKAVSFIPSRNPAVFPIFVFFFNFEHKWVCVPRGIDAIQSCSVLEFYELLNVLDNKVCIAK